MGKLIMMVLRKHGLAKGAKMLKKIGLSGVEIGKVTAKMAKEGGAPFKEALRKTGAASGKRILDNAMIHVAKASTRKPGLMPPRGRNPREPWIRDTWGGGRRGGDITPKVIRGGVTPAPGGRVPGGIAVRPGRIGMPKGGPGLQRIPTRLRKELERRGIDPSILGRRPKRRDFDRWSTRQDARKYMKKIARGRRQTAMNRRVFEFQQWALHKFGKVITPDQAKMAIKMGAAGVGGGLAGYGLAGGFGGGGEAPMQGPPPPPEFDRFTTMTPSGV